MAAQHPIHGPAAARVRPRPAAVVEDVGVVAAGVFEGIGEDGQVLEPPFVLEGLRDPSAAIIFPLQND